MKQVTALKLTCVGAFVATLGVGCASSGYARYDADQTDADQGVGVSASADVGTDSSASVSTDSNLRTDRTTVVRTDRDNDRLAMDMDTGSGPLNVPDTEGEERVTV